MKERPIIFNAEMVRAVLDGRKTQTRRVIKPQPMLEKGNGCAADGWAIDLPGNVFFAAFNTNNSFAEAIRPWCPYGKPGDRLWVRETWQILFWHEVSLMGYEAETIPKEKPEREHEMLYPEGFPDVHVKYRPSIHMPRWASRINLEVTGVRAERVQDISEDDAAAEGVSEKRISDPANPDTIADSHRMAFADLWDSINAKRDFDWASNPWVWVVEFKLSESNARGSDND